MTIGDEDTESDSWRKAECAAACAVSLPGNGLHGNGAGLYRSERRLCREKFFCGFGGERF
jgi:hypothetical protein